MVRRAIAQWFGVLLPLGMSVCSGCGTAVSDLDWASAQPTAVVRELPPPEAFPAHVAAKAIPIGHTKADEGDAVPIVGAPESTTNESHSLQRLTDPPAFRLPPSASAPPSASDPKSSRRTGPVEGATQDRPAPPYEPGEQTALPWAHIRPRTAELAAVLDQVEALTRRGVDLSSRGATYSARENFLLALRRISQALDAQQQTDFHAKALAAGLTALAESRDFAAARADVSFDLPTVLAGHRTPVLQGRAAGATPLTAQQRYLTFAQEQLAAATGRESAGSAALFQMGKAVLHESSRAGKDTFDVRGQVMAWYQAALLADERNFLAAHELGVLLAQCGRLEQARNLLFQAATIGQQPASWQNLAIVHQRLGETDAAAQARARLAAAEKQQASRTKKSPVLWVDPATLAQIQSPTDGLSVPSTAVPTQHEEAAARPSSSGSTSANPRAPRR